MNEDFDPELLAALTPGPHVHAVAWSSSNTYEGAPPPWATCTCGQLWTACSSEVERRLETPEAAGPIPAERANYVLTDADVEAIIQAFKPDVVFVCGPPQDSR